jgi:ribosomal protein S27AE
MYVTRCIDSLGRHLRALKDCKVDEDHAAAAMCNVSFIIHYIKEIEAGRLDPKWDDRFDFKLYAPSAVDTTGVDYTLAHELTCVDKCAQCGDSSNLVPVQRKLIWDIRCGKCGYTMGARSTWVAEENVIKEKQV